MMLNNETSVQQGLHELQCAGEQKRSSAGAVWSTALSNVYICTIESLRVCTET